MTSLALSSAAGALDSSSIVVIKIGSSLLVDPDEDRFNHDWFISLVTDIAKLKEQNKKIILVSSGAIALGRLIVGETRPRINLDRSQALASIGQISLAHQFEQALKHHQIVAAQVLLTLEDTEERKRYLNARNALTQLLDMGAIPIINENDTVATSEIRYGDNDRLAARVAQMMSAECLVLLSDVDGLYDRDPNRHADAVLLERIESITDEVVAMAGAPFSRYGTGGMATKIEAARMALNNGCHMILSSGLEHHPVTRITEGQACSHFVSQKTPVTQRKRWIAGTLKICGEVTVDQGAIDALHQGGSLLPVGVTASTGKFERGDAVAVLDPAQKEVARGLSAYAHDEVTKICGKNSASLFELLGYHGSPELIHRDDLVLISKDQLNE